MTTTGMDAFEMSEDQVPQDPPEGEDDKWGALRLIGLVALVAAFSGFVYLAYMQGVRNGAVGAPPVITAEVGPYKVVPADPGGRTFENVDKKVFDRVEGESLAQNSHAAPPPETPDQHSSAKPGTDHVVDGQTGALVIADGSPVTPTQRPSGIAGATERTFTAKGGPINPLTVQSPQKVADVPKPLQPLVTTEAAKPTPAKTASAEPASTATSAARTGSYVIQIASYRDKPSAEDAWKKLVSKHSDLVSTLSPDYQTAEVANKGTYFRLRIGPFTSKDDATAMCSALKARQQDCLVVKS